MKFVTYNIQFGRGRDGRFDLARIDYCVASTALTSCIGAVRIDANPQGSDHQPVWMDLAL